MHDVLKVWNTQPIPGDAIVAAVRALAAGAPDHVYTRPPLSPDNDPGDDEGCFNHKDADGEGPGHGCLIGQAFRACGVPEAVLTAKNPLYPKRFVFTDARNDCQLLNELGSSISGDVIRWLSHVQGQQDEGTEWAACVTFADAIAPLPTWTKQKPLS